MIFAGLNSNRNFYSRKNHLSVTKIASQSRTRRDKACLVSTFQLPKILQKRYRPAILVTLESFNSMEIFAIEHKNE